MSQYVFGFNQAGHSDQLGGKGRVLAELTQAGYRAPQGCVVIPDAFKNGQLKPSAVEQIKQALSDLGADSYSVRSSALAEDSKAASFAGEFESYLNNKTETDVLAAVVKVYESSETERVKEYSRAKGIDSQHQVAVIIQAMIQSEYSGVLFTSDPVTGSHNVMAGNYVKGLGDKLVSGEVSGVEFKIDKKKPKARGLGKLSGYTKQLWKLGRDLEKHFSTPQDIEWAIANGQLFLLQSRPVTTFIEVDEKTQDWNSSRVGDYLWIAMLEQYPEKLTPSSWSLWDKFFDTRFIGFPWMGNIGGTIYMNLSYMYAFLRTAFMNHEQAIKYIESTTGTIPEGVEIPKCDFNTWSLVRVVYGQQKKYGGWIQAIKMRTNPMSHVEKSPQIYTGLVSKIAKCQKEQDLLDLWPSVLEYFRDCFNAQGSSNKKYFMSFKAFREKMDKWVGKNAALKILSTYSLEGQELESVGIGGGIKEVAEGKISKKEYLERFGHRLTNENELSESRPLEQPKWLDQEIEKYQKQPVDYAQRQKKRTQDYQQVLVKIKDRKKLELIKSGMEQLGKVLQDREKIRSELSRALYCMRLFYLEAGKVLKIGDGVFMITIDELVEALQGETEVLNLIEARQKVFDKYNKLPKYTVFIRGRFDPILWSKDPNRNEVIAGIKQVKQTKNKVIKGTPGSSGRVKGRARVISSFAKAGELKKGEILVTTTTNVGWTPTFSKASAVVTEVGGSLAHAAVVARELGIPAVVGAMGVTQRLTTGDEIIVDGTQGTIEILKS